MNLQVRVYHPKSRTNCLLGLNFARQNGVDALYDAIAIDNSAVALFLACGFGEVLRTDEYILLKKELR